MSYALFIAPAAERDIRGLDPQVRRRVVAAVEALAQDPHPPSSTKLVGFHARWRLRVGDYRVLYEIDDGKLTIVVVAVGHRREIYR